MERISENDVRIEQVLYKQSGRVEVYKVFHHSTGKMICMKKIFVDNVNEGTTIQSEFIAMASLDHPNILSLKSASLGGHGNSITHLSIYMDYFEEGDLEKLIQAQIKSGIAFTEAELFNYLKQLVGAYGYMQERNMAHRDIKPQNIFVCDKGKTLKVGDLGSVAKTDTGSGGTLIGTPLYLSPKLREAYLNNMGSSTIDHNVFKSDVYSLGLTLMYMASFKPVHDLCTINNLEEKVKARVNDLNSQYKGFKRIMRSMLKVSESDRPDFLKLKKIIESVEKPEKEVLSWENWKRVGSVKLSELKGVCEYCKNEVREKEIFLIGEYLICCRCYGMLFNQCGIYYLTYNSVTYSYPDQRESENFELCSYCKFLVHQGTCCLANFWATKDFQYSCWQCRRCQDTVYIYKNTASYFVSCEKGHYFCCVCENEFNYHSHELCKILYSELPITTATFK